jgi:phytoene/squalene synthetase
MPGSKLSSGSGSQPASSAALARLITRRASRQTYHTIRWLVDGGRTDDAFRAYAYFRWVDDVVDAPSYDRSTRLHFLFHQRQLQSGLLAGVTPGHLLPEEQMVADLIAGRDSQHPGLLSYLEQMMTVMEFDAGRRGRLITEIELDRYSQLLATAVMGAISYFIGHDHVYPEAPARIRAVVGAHIIHMLHDTYDDLEAGYFNIPRAALEMHRLTPSDTQHPAYRRWVRARVDEARDCFDEGKAYIRRMGCLRATLAGYMYCARFEAVLRWIELDGYRLRIQYSRLPPMPVWITRFAATHRAAMHGPRKTPTGGGS